jgi:hypothetical protein
MSRTITLPALLAALFLFAAPLAAEIIKPPRESGMKPIFNGKDLTGWDGDPRLWKVKDGAIRGETTKQAAAKSGNTFIIWKAGKTKDFELRLSFRCNATNNSGIQYRSKQSSRGANKWVVKGYQHEIRNQNKLSSVSGFIYEEGGGRGRMALVGDKTVWGKDKKKKIVGKLINAEEYKKLFKLNEWNEVVIIAKGPHLQHFTNGRQIMDCVDDHPDRSKRDGVLAFQLHAGRPMWAEFKDIRFKELK